MRIAIGGDDGYNCTQINNNFCEFNSLPLKSKLRGSYQVTTSLIIPPIVVAIDPNQAANLLLQDLLVAFVAGLAFAGLPEAAMLAAGVSAATMAASKALVTELQQAPNVAKAIWPSGTSESQTFQINQLDTALANVSSMLSDNINAGLAELMTNQSAFAAFASSGAFTGETKLSIPDDVASLTTALRLFLTSKALTVNK
ncbi:hypothetical protein OEA41_005697 [Lepraria neglecta]|uniref:Uncharacterized protein n=1 Tax=Lepraria neglecta TaxID=209136 RepID=A0AAE0DJZ1_9LECA|nr:hypothetical protein OEA41_005697 [Lepraria neglecta]